MLRRSYTLDPSYELGGGWRLKLFEDGVEAGGGVFPVTVDPVAGIAWFNGLSEQDRALWLKIADSARPVEAWVAYLSAAAFQEAKDEAESFVGYQVNP